MPRLRTLACDLSLLLLVAVLAMWARSHQYADTFRLRTAPGAALSLESRRGGLTLGAAEFRTPVFGRDGDEDGPAVWTCEWLRPPSRGDDADPSTLLGFRWGGGRGHRVVAPHALCGRRARAGGGAGGAVVLVAATAARRAAGPLPGVRV